MKDTIYDTIDGDKFIEMLSLDVSLDMKDDVIVQKELDIKYVNGLMSPNIRFYFDRYICGDKITVYLNNKDISRVLGNYASKQGCTLSGYKYIGGVRKVGYFVNENQPFFEGVVLEMKKVKKKIKK